MTWIPAKDPDNNLVGMCETSLHKPVSRKLTHWISCLLCT